LILKIDYANKLVLITGGSSGIGFALAKQLVTEGAHVFILARDKHRLASAVETLQQLAKPDQKIGSIQLDVTKSKELEAPLTKWIEKQGTPDLLVNSAGVAHPGYFQELATEIFQWMMDVNYFGMVNVTKVIIPYMIARGSGQVVNISSEAGFIGVFGYTAYGASKYAVRGFTDALRAEMKPLGVNLSIVFPPDTQTPQLEYEQQFKPAETKAIAGSSTVMTPEKVASIVIRNIKHNRYLIIPGFEGKVFYRLTSILKHSTYPIMDMLVRSAQKKKLRDIKKLLD
jgi:3-dehydrosphinganine reductase